MNLHELLSVVWTWLSERSAGELAAIPPAVFVAIVAAWRTLKTSWDTLIWMGSRIKTAGHSLLAWIVRPSDTKRRLKVVEETIEALFDLVSKQSGAVSSEAKPADRVRLVMKQDCKK